VSTVGELLAAEATLPGASDTPRLDAELLLAHCLGTPRSHLYAHPEKIVPPGPAARFWELARRCRQGEPVAYLRGQRAFWTLEIKTDPRALVPRPETELLVSAALERLPRSCRGYAADLGTGSGAIALALTKERPALKMLATDISGRALALAAENRRRLGCDSLHLARGSWCAPLAKNSFSLVVANPPYLAEDDPVLGVVPLCLEPREALAAGADGLAAIRAMIPEVHQCLIAGGLFLVEHAPQQAGAVRHMLEQHGYRGIETLRDLGGQPRAAAGRRR